MSYKKKKKVWSPPIHALSTADVRLVSTAPGLPFSISIENFRCETVEEAIRSGVDGRDELLCSLWESAREAADEKAFFCGDQEEECEQAAGDAMFEQLYPIFKDHVFAEVVSKDGTAVRAPLPENLLKESLRGYAFGWAVFFGDEPVYVDSACRCAANFLKKGVWQAVFDRNRVTGRSAPALIFALPDDEHSAPEPLKISAGELDDQSLVIRARDIVYTDPLDLLGMDRDRLHFVDDVATLDHAWTEVIAACPLTPILEYADTEVDGEYEEEAVTAAKIRAAIDRLYAESIAAAQSRR